jgi:hypothetical protein
MNFISDDKKYLRRKIYLRTRDVITVTLLFIVIALNFSCKTSNQSSRPKPQWINNRPINNQYYIGVGVLSKSNNKDYQYLAKRNALNDLISEIKVTLSSNSILSQYQNNKEFTQQFESESRLATLQTIEEFELVDSWEDQTTYWVYYRLSKEKYNEIKRKKMTAAIERAENFYQSSLSINIQTDYMQALRLKLRAIISIQDYLNENIESVINGKSVLLVNELFQSIQEQLSMIKVESINDDLQAKVGKSNIPFIWAKASLKGNESIGVAHLPMRGYTESGNIVTGQTVSTNTNGETSIIITSFISKQPIQTLRISPDIEQIIQIDTLHYALYTILSKLDVNSTTVKFQVKPLLVHIKGEEKNLSVKMTLPPFESELRKSLGEYGCQFVSEPKEADYILTIQSDTKHQGPIWGNMQRTTLNLSIKLSDAKTQADVFKDALKDINGYQITPENAGLDAYKTATNTLIKDIYPRLMFELFQIK